MNTRLLGFAMCVGTRIKLLRLALGFRKASDFAKFIGVEKSRLSNVETGGVGLSPDFARKIITKIPEVSIDYLWLGDQRFLTFELRQKIEVAAAEFPDLQKCA